MNHQQLLEQEQAAAIKAQQAAADEQGLYEIYRAHKELKPCIANDEIIRKHFNGDTINLKHFDADRGYGAMAGLALWSDEEKRGHLEKEIMKRLPAMSPQQKQGWQRRFHAKLNDEYLYTTAQMETKLTNLKTGQDHEDLSHEELVEEVTSQRTVGGGFPELPSTITAFQLRMMTAAELKKTIQKFGLQQINQRLRETA